MVLDALNTKRRDHIVDNLTLDTTQAPALHKLVTKSTQVWTDSAKRPSDVAVPGGGKWQEVWFYDADTAALFSSSKSVNGWYAGNKNYDFATHFCKRTAKPLDTVTVAAGDAYFAKIKIEMENCNNFRKIIWKSASTAAFAVRDSWVVAWIQYPTTAPTLEVYTYAARTTVVAFSAATETKDTTPNTANVLKKCLKDSYNECVVTKELNGHNDARLARKDAPALTHDSKASVKI
jgi:hypothetical protein